MSIVAYYARLTADQFEQCAKNPELLRSGEVGHLPGAEVIDVDRSWDPIAWLVSPRKRAEQERQTLSIHEAIANRRPQPTIASRIAGLFKPKKAPPKPSPAVMESFKRIEEFPIDLPLMAIEGRTEKRDERFQFGLGSASVFKPDEVLKLHEALATINVDTLEKKYNPQILDQAGVFPEHWVDEGRELMDTYIIPNFQSIQTFYAKAVQARQMVLVWFC